MKALKSILIITLTAALLLNTSCLSSEQSDSIKNNSDKKLSIWYLEYDTCTKYRIQKSKAMYPDIEIAETVYKIENLQDMLTKQSAELMAGAGPDIILFYNHYFGSLNKALNSGAFTDLNALIKKDKEFNENEYYKKIFDAGIYNGKRLYIPLNYSIPYFTTTESTLKENNINIEKTGISLENLSELAKNFTNSKGKKLINSSFRFTDIMSISKLEFVDKKAKKSNFNSKEFIRLLEEFKNIYPSIATYDEHIKYEHNADMIAADKLIFGYDTINSSPQSLRYFNSNYISAIGDKMKIIPIVNKGACSALPMELVGINDNCSDKESAFRIVIFMLSKDMQKAKNRSGASNNNIYLPVNKQAFKEDLQFCTENSETGSGAIFPIVQLPKSIADKMEMMIENSQLIQPIDINITRLVNKEIDKYLKGKTSAQQTAKAIDEKVTLFLNE